MVETRSGSHILQDLICDVLELCGPMSVEVLKRWIKGYANHRHMSNSTFSWALRTLRKKGKIEVDGDLKSGVLSIKASDELDRGANL